MWPAGQNKQAVSKETSGLGLGVRMTHIMASSAAGNRATPCGPPSPSLTFSSVSLLQGLQTNARGCRQLHICPDVHTRGVSTLSTLPGAPSSCEKVPPVKVPQQCPRGTSSDQLFGVRDSPWGQTHQNSTLQTLEALSEAGSGGRHQTEPLPLLAASPHDLCTCIPSVLHVLTRCLQLPTSSA